MGRRKVRYELISNESARKVTFKKRLPGLLKKMKELSTLCGVKACAIVYGSRNPKPDVWPSPSDALRVLDDFKNLPTRKQGRYMMDQELLLMKTVSKLNEKLEKQKAKNQVLELELAAAELVADEIRDSNHLQKLNGVILLLNEQIRCATSKIGSKSD